MWRCGASQGALLQGQIRIKVDLRGLDALVAEPEGDDGAIDAGLEQMNRGGVAQRVRGDVLARKRRGGTVGDLEVLGE